MRRPTQDTARFRVLRATTAVAFAVAAIALLAVPSARAGLAVCDVAVTSGSTVVGGQITVTGTGFAPNTPISVTIQPPIGPGGAQGGPTDGAGSFAVTFVPGQPGSWTLTFTQASGCSDSVSVPVTCATALTPNSTNPAVGDFVTVTGTGFAASTPISTTIQPPTGPGGAQGGPTDATGSFAVSFLANQPGNWTLTFTQTPGCSDSLTVAVGAVGASPTPAPSGSGLPDTATADEGPSGTGVVIALLLGACLVLAAAAARSRRPT
jgi:hypothetical protein